MDELTYIARLEKRLRREKNRVREMRDYNLVLSLANFILMLLIAIAYNC